MKIRHALAGASVAALIAAGGSSYALGVSSPSLGPLTNILGALVYGHVANNAALAQMPVALGRVRRDGFAAAGDGGAADYTLSAAPCLIVNANGTPIGDGGSQVVLNAGGCAVIDTSTSKVTPLTFGAVANSTGVTGVGNDDTVALQAWLTYGANYHAQLSLPGLGGNRVYRSTAPLRVLNSVTIEGDYCTPTYQVTSFVAGSGSIIFFDHPGRGLSFLGGENVINNVCTFRAQPDPTLAANATFTPGTFDFDIYTEADIDIRNVVLIDPTNGVYARFGRFWIENLKGHPLTEGIKTYALLDTAKWHDIHFWPYSAGNAANVFAWQYANLVAFDLARMDNAQLDAVSSIIQSTCFKFSANPSSASPYQGTANKIRVNGADCDGIGSGWGIYVDPSVTTGVPLTAAFTNFTTQTSNAPGNSPYGGGGLDVEGSASTISFAGNFQSTFAGGNAVAVNGTANDVRFANPYIQDWGMVNTSSPAFTVSAGNHVSYGPDWPHFDFALNANDETYYGGSAYTIANGSKLSFPAGTGALHAIDITDNSMVDVLQIGGMQTLTQTGPASAVFVNAGGGSDTTCLSNTPSGKVGLCYSTTTATYAAFNNTGHVVVLLYQDQRAWPVN